MRNSNRIIHIIIILAIVVLINIISLRVFFRWDISEGKVYSLAKISKETMRHLEDDLEVKAYFSGTLPPPHNGTYRFLKDKLAEYQAYAGDKMRFRFIDPTDNQELQQEAQQLGVPPLQMNILENDEYVIKRVFMGLVFFYQGKKEVIPIVQQTQGLEYDITRTILRLTKERKAKIALLQGHGEFTLQEEMKNVVAITEKDYELKPYTIENQKLIPDMYDMVLIASPHDTFPEWDLYALDQFVMNGGSIAVLQDDVDENFQQSQARAIGDIGLNTLWSNYGFRVASNLLSDAQCNQVAVEQRQGFFSIRRSIPYPFFVLSNRFNEESNIVKDLERLSFYFPARIDTSLAQKRGVSVTPLVYSSAKTHVQTPPYNIQPNAELNTDTYRLPPQILAAVIQGNLQTAFSRSLPDGANAETHKTSTENGRILVIADDDIVNATYADMQSTGENYVFFLNSLDWMLQDEALISMRSREITDRTIDELNPTKRAIVKWISVLLPPLLLIVFGLIHWALRKKRQNWITQIYGR